MCASDEFEAVDVIELGSNLVTKQPTSTTRGDSPSLNILRIRPDEITKGPLMRNFLSTSDNTNLINSSDLRAQTTVNAKDLAVNDSSKDEEIKDLANP